MLPWELLYDRRQNSFIAQSERTPVVRYLEVPLTPRAPSTSTGRCASSSSSPRRPTCPSSTSRPSGAASRPLWPTGWLAGHGAPRPARTAHAAGPVRRGSAATTSTSSTSSVMASTTRQSQDGVLYFTDRYGRRAPVSSSMLGPYLRDHDPLRLVFLNACQSARDRQLRTRSARWPRVWSSRTASRSSPCSSPSATAPRPSSPASSTARSPTDSRSTSRSAADARPCSPGMRRSGRRRCSSSATPRAGSSTTSCRSVARTLLRCGRRGSRGLGGRRCVRGGRRCGCRRRRRGRRRDRTRNRGRGRRRRTSPPRPPPNSLPRPTVPAVTPSEPDPPASECHGVRPPTRPPARPPARLRCLPLSARPRPTAPPWKPAPQPPTAAAAATLPAAVASSPRPPSAQARRRRRPTPCGSPSGATPPPNRFAGRIVALVLVLGLLGYLGWWFAQNRATDDDGTATPPHDDERDDRARRPPATRRRRVASRSPSPATRRGPTPASPANPAGASSSTPAGPCPMTRQRRSVPTATRTRTCASSTCPGLPDANHGALVASLDAKAPFTVVGGSATYQCQAAGELVPRSERRRRGQQRGQWTVTVTPSG